ncbi:hypothetical protein KIS1582_2240 [Cytobacillus firmus]|uniref:Lipoprotein n=1 Tax=Cytobacillus firmus TaxID=1399 RepID=A0A800MXC3_CYTFI|nr:hypothetical protein KIS1582_2240 [Cytobacillus firmus]
MHYLKTRSALSLLVFAACGLLKLHLSKPSKKFLFFRLFSLHF